MSAIVESQPQTTAGAAKTSIFNCRFCQKPLQRTFVDLGMSPLCQTHIAPNELHMMEPFYPLHVYLCDDCFLVQLPEHVAPKDIFTDYAYFSSFSDTMLRHASNYVDMMTTRFGLGANSLVVELASNDGYLLQYFVAKQIPVLGIEPAANVAQVAIRKGVPSISEFFGRELACRLRNEGRRADVILGNNVLAHVPDINDFVGGAKILLEPNGVVTMEFPHLTKLVDLNYWDTIYHEHFSYLSLTTVQSIFAAQGLTVFDVDEIPMHGGSLRIYAQHTENNVNRPVTQNVTRLIEAERTWGVTNVERYRAFEEQVKATKRQILQFFIEAKNAGKSVAGYGAPGKGNTLLNYCGIRTDFLDYTCDRSPYKNGKYTPGTRIPIMDPSRIRETKPDYLFILAWNLKDEVIAQNSYIREWGGKFVVPMPTLTVIE